MTMRSLDSTASVFDTERGRSAAIAIWLGILLDGIPESLVLGIMSNEATDLRNPGLMYSLTFSVLISNLPEALVTVAAHAGEAATRLDGKPRLFNKQKAKMGAQEAWTCCVDKARGDFGFETEVKPAEGTRRTHEWYRREGWY